MNVLAGSPLFDISFKDIDGNDTSLEAFAGQVLLVVNVASECGYTPQYAGLEGLHQKLKDRGFAVLGFPCNDFGGQEPGSNEQIKHFCQENYNVTFPMFEKVTMDSPLYSALAADAGKVSWNFEKILIGKDGKVIAKFGSDVEPEATELTAAIDKALSK